jgi:septin family protein
MLLPPLLLVENENHCDFVKLREMLIRVNMEDLREQTHSRHYELYRRCKLEEMGFQDSDGDSQPFRSALPQPLLSHQHLLSQAWEPAGRGWWEP